MGDIADDLVDQAIFGEMFYHRAPKFPRCQHCGAICLWHESRGGRWVLFEGGKRHKCSEKILHAKAANDFDAVQQEQGK